MHLTTARGGPVWYTEHDSLPANAAAAIQHPGLLSTLPSALKDRGLSSAAMGAADNDMVQSLTTPAAPGRVSGKAQLQPPSYSHIEV